MGRIEKYIDIDGMIRKAVSYGMDDFKLKVWYSLDQIIQAFPNWKYEESTKFYNGRKFGMQVKRSSNNDNTSRNKPRVPLDQSQDIQGKRGTRGRGLITTQGQNSPKVEVEVGEDLSTEEGEDPLRGTLNG